MSAIDKLKELAKIAGEINRLGHLVRKAIDEASESIKSIDPESYNKDKSDILYGLGYGIREALWAGDIDWRDLAGDISGKIESAVVDVSVGVSIYEHKQSRVGEVIEPHVPTPYEVVMGVIAEGNSMQYTLVLSHDFAIALSDATNTPKMIKDAAIIYGFTVQWVDGDKVCRLEPILPETDEGG